MAQYVHGTSVQQCVLDQLSGPSVAQFTHTSNMSCITYESVSASQRKLGKKPATIPI